MLPSRKDAGSPTTTCEGFLALSLLLLPSASFMVLVRLPDLSRGRALGVLSFGE